MQKRVFGGIFVLVFAAILLASVFAVPLVSASSDGGFWGWLKSLFTGKSVTGQVVGDGGCMASGCEASDYDIRDLDNFRQRYDSDIPGYDSCYWNSDDYTMSDMCYMGGYWIFSGPEGYECDGCQFDGTGCDSIYDTNTLNVVCSGNCNCAQYLCGFPMGFQCGGPVCGDGQCTPGEDNSNCPQDCPPVCGNGVVETGEVCDDGNTAIERCGDGRTQSGTYCNSDCSAQITLNEQCDGNSGYCTVGGYGGTRTCSASCTWNTCTATQSCGDGSINGPENCDGTNLGSPVPHGTLLNVTNVSAGNSHTCAVLLDGTLRCWGSNTYGWLGDGTQTSRDGPVQVVGITNAIQISAGTEHTCALLSDGTIKCWGRGDGKLGYVDWNMHTTPVQVVNLTSAVQISAGPYHTCALIAGGTIKCWGGNSYGQLGDGTTAIRGTPVQVLGINNAIQISVGTQHTCAVLSDHTIKCWGYNYYYGQLGDGTTVVNRLTPVLVVGITNAVQVAAGYDHTCALLSDNTIKCWGHNDQGQLGIGVYDFSAHPVPSSPVLGITNAVQLSSQDRSVCAVLSTGTVKCWGNNILTPALVSGVTNVVSIEVGASNSGAVLSDKTATAWGGGQLGLGSNGKVMDHMGPPACDSLGYLYGTLVCNSSCRYTGCYNFVCGNNIIEGTEVCDGNSQACTVGGYAGTQSCNAQCTGWNACSATESCGDGVINDAEQCDGSDLNGKTCQTQGFQYGTLACTMPGCAFDTSGCYNQVCGNGIKEGTEECDDGSAQTPASCGVGGCARTIADSCVNCMNVACVSGDPQPEICNSADDDCDSDFDEDLTQACYDGPAGTENIGLCHGGMQTCAAGSWGACVGEVLPGVETCNPDVNNNNGVDENCDGSDLDCGFTCDRDSDGYRDASRWYCFGNDCDDQNANVHPDALEVCNGIDDNCNNLVDEDLGSTTCGLGICLHTVQNCVNGVPQTCNPMQGATTEACNGLDDDCNGVVDNGCPSVDKMSVLTTLNSLKPTESEAKKQLNYAIGEINKSLGNLNLAFGDKDIIWLDSVHLLCKGGDKAFEHEKKAVYHLQKAISATKNTGIKTQLNDAISAIVSIDRMLAQVAIAQAQTLVSSGQVRQYDVDKANAALAKGDVETKPTNKVEYYKKAWKYANKKCALEPNTCIESITVKSPSGEIVTATGDEISNILPSLETQFVDSSNANVKIQTSCSKCLKVGQSFGGWVIQEMIYKPGQETTMTKVCGR